MANHKSAKKRSKQTLKRNKVNKSMLSKIKKSIPGRLMSIEHLGIVVDGVEDVQSNAAKSWAGAMEDYTLEVIEGHTLLRLKIDVVEAYKNFFLKTWPKALDSIKELAEKQS